jgi:cyclopropane fatty-acyl-phospholipid synthase-like methyltransferase
MLVNRKMDLITVAAAVILSFLFVVFIIFFVLSGLFGAPWVPTNSETVDKMLLMADIKPDEVVYDLGSGDGRIVMTAARKFHARSVGVEVNPILVFWTRLRITALGLRSRTKVIWGDLFKVDLSKADVVTVYLLQDTNNKLVSKLKNELKTGGRVVSHAFTFNDWVPVDEDPKLKIYLYVVKN